MRFVIGLVLFLMTSSLALAAPADDARTAGEGLKSAIVDYYTNPTGSFDRARLQTAADVLQQIDPGIATGAKELATSGDVPTAVGTLSARLQQALTQRIAIAVRAGDIDAAKRWRAELSLPRGVSLVEGTLLLEELAKKPDKRDEVSRLLVREAITLQTTRVRQLLGQVERSAVDKNPMPSRLRELLAEAMTLSDLPASLVKDAGIEKLNAADPAELQKLRQVVVSAEWGEVRKHYPALRKAVESSLPSLLTATERTRRERLLLKLIQLVPREYAAGVREGQVTVPLEYREAIAFTAQAKQFVGELAPLWLAEGDDRREALSKLEDHLDVAQAKIDAIAHADDVEAPLKEAAKILQKDFDINLSRRGTTADIVDEVMLETRALLTQSLAAALNGQWAEAEQLRLEAYTTYDPELEARLMPRDPTLALDIELLLLDGKEKPGVKAMLDKRASSQELQEAYQRVSDELAKASALLKSGVSPTAAVFNAASIVLREGLEGLLVIIAIFAGLRGDVNARRRRLFWVGILAAVGVTALTWALSQTIITSLRGYGEYIEAITGVIAIIVLLIITNWLFHQVYWKQWITSLKSQAAEGESAWSLITVGFAVGYREGFEIVLFMQSLVLDAGGANVAIGVGIGSALLLVLGVAGLYYGLKLPYFKLLMLTAVLIGLVLITFTGGTIRGLQTVGWLPVHRLMDGSWPSWMGQWLGIYNTWESVLGQVLAICIVLGTWRVARYQARKKGAKRRSAHQQQAESTTTGVIPTQQ